MMTILTCEDREDMLCLNQTGVSICSFSRFLCLQLCHSRTHKYKYTIAEMKIAYIIAEILRIRYNHIDCLFCSIYSLVVDQI